MCFLCVTLCNKSIVSMSTRQKLQNKAYIPERWETVNCPVCNSNEFKRWEKFGNKMQYTYVLCKKCKLVYLNPRPVYDETFVFDAYEFYADDDDRYIFTDDFYNTQTSFEKQEVIEICKFDTHRANLLDVGCAAGKFLFRAKPFFKKVIGLEVSSRMAELVRDKLNINVLTDKFEDVIYHEKFSCINISHVIEHFPYPHVWLQKAKSLLEEDGILVISVPNMFSLDRLVKRFVKKIGLFKNAWAPWRTPDHLFEPTVKAMKFLINNEGFMIIDYYSYSRKKMNVNSLSGRIYHRFFRFGSNLKFILKLNKSNNEGL